MIVVAIGDERFTYGGGAWRGRNDDLVATLELLAAERRETRLGPVADPDRDIVDDALLKLGGRLVSLKGHRGADTVPGRIY